MAGLGFAHCVSFVPCFPLPSNDISSRIKNSPKNLKKNLFAIFRLQNSRKLTYIVPLLYVFPSQNKQSRISLLVDFTKGIPNNFILSQEISFFYLWQCLPFCLCFSHGYVPIAMNIWREKIQILVAFLSSFPKIYGFMYLFWSYLYELRF